ncbi:MULTISPECIES: acyl-CoA dehydrogenase family protein [Mycolicibacterium]|uniref:Acyl-CoA dehydrogenase family protein n=1 Tax=Mycolicibacterium austroafricanum TaxID=39687 RepID=A0ABT8HAK7_MYCAO|nr:MULTISPECIES: acyl-CoA dehydrogenase family protein [Mycolicibacterium]MDN4517776.1 acyl-CoA dehydrogenase family protein [Mycolicibacterium austroafricanum]PQP43945.1 acyl-CoA dehydrogenase [Mycolicibacterium austroafricanum]QRZ09861.1 acyl-CoA dehydrogenase family protein [Mycolicibacterium austroafricanum]QZT71321.1 acyl-CoA dehydrogenase family protein [Mycolicibacterium austroafricanum]
MDFSEVELSDDDRAFQAELRGFLARVVTDDVIERDRRTGDNFDETVHLALGAAGYLERDWRAGQDGGFTAVQRRIFELEIGRAHTPWFHWGTTSMVAKAVDQFGSDELKDEVLDRVLSGEFRLCLGYTEPDGGSDVATCKTRAVRDGDGWIVNGSKMFTSNAHHAQYVFLITNTDPAAPKHQSLTMFLVPLDATGVEIQPIRTVDGDRTNITFYSDVRIDDRYRVGAVNGGWAVLREALNAEHGTVEHDDSGLNKIAVMTEHATLLADEVDRIAGEMYRSGRLDDDSIGYRLGRSIARLEAALSTPEMFGRVAIAQTLRDITPDLMDVLGTTSVVPEGLNAEYLFRLALPTGIYGGTLDVFRNMIAQHALGLGRPNYSPPVQRP